MHERNHNQNLRLQKTFLLAFPAMDGHLKPHSDKQNSRDPNFQNRTFDETPNKSSLGNCYIRSTYRTSMTQ